MGLMRRVKKYKAFFVDKAGNNIDYTTFVYARDSGEAMDRANNIMQEMQDDNLSHAIVTLIINSRDNWSGIYR
jgi:predicted alpha/beta superfamily hydrolase